jgi:Sulfotransferase domain
MTQMVQKGKLMNTFETLSQPRTIKTHLPVQLLPDQVWMKKPKIIYCSRDSRDVAISMFHFGTHYDNTVPMSQFLENFLNDECIFCPYREHRLNYWKILDYPHILYLTYESMISNIDEAIRKVSNFLGVTVSDENFLKLKQHLSFDKMKSK